MVRFSREEPQTGRRRVDVSAKPTAGFVIAGRAYSIYDAFLVIEGKRLPAPSRGREREYVSSGKEITGGIQRFKLGLHGALLEHAVMVGYLQNEDAGFWFKAINGWIDDLCGTSDDGCIWEVLDRLCSLTEMGDAGMSICRSTHTRLVHCVSGSIELEHAWIAMN